MALSDDDKLTIKEAANIMTRGRPGSAFNLLATAMLAVAELHAGTGARNDPWAKQVRALGEICQAIYRLYQD